MDGRCGSVCVYVYEAEVDGWLFVVSGSVGVLCACAGGTVGGGRFGVLVVNAGGGGGWGEVGWARPAGEIGAGPGVGRVGTDPPPPLVAARLLISNPSLRRFWMPTASEIRRGTMRSKEEDAPVTKRRR